MENESSHQYAHIFVKTSNLVISRRRYAETANMCVPHVQYDYFCSVLNQ